MRILMLAAALALAACGRSDLAESRAGATRCLTELSGLDLQAATALEIRDALASGKLDGEALMQAYLDRIATFDAAGPKLNSIRTLAPDALQQAAAKHDGPLAGLPILLKDNIGTTDMPTTAGSIALAGNIPKHEATITTKLRQAGAIVMGKANLSEFANWVDLNMPNGYSSLGGQVIAPYDFTLDPYGSSTGSAVAGTMAFAALTIGSETSGSIIAPAYIHSMVGVKPTVGLVSRYGIIPLAASFDTAGPIVRSVTDAALLLGVIAGVDDKDAATQAFVDSELHGVVPDYLAALHRGALQGVKLGVRSQDMDSAEATWLAAMKALQALGATLVPIDDPQDVDTFIAEVELAAIPNEFKFGLNRYLADEAGPGLPAYDLTGIILYNNDHPDQVKYGQSLLIASDATSGTELDPASVAARTAAQQAARAWTDVNIDQNGLAAIVAPDLNGYAVAAAAGYPSLTVPSGYAGREPHGITFAGKAFSEAQLLALAYDYEQATHLRKPATRVNSELRHFCPD